MSVKITGKPDALLAIRKKLLDGTSDETRTRLNEHIAREAIKLVHRGFREQVAPDGEAWAPLKRQRSRQGKKKRGDLILRKDGNLRNSFTMRDVSAGGFVVGSSVQYAAHHQFGTKGRTKAYSRSQAVNKRGKFMKHAKAAKQKRGAVGFRILNFQAGGGKIPARPMLPEGELPERWQKPLERTATTFLKKALEP